MDDEDYSHLDDPDRECLCMDCVERRGELGDLGDDFEDDDSGQDDIDEEDASKSGIAQANQQERALKAMGF